MSRLDRRRAGSTLAAAALLGALAPAAGAQPLVDPTRPPASIAAPARGDAAPPGAPVLQSVLISGERRSAIISGEFVPLGGRYGDARLAAVRPDGVTLDTPRGTEVLRLAPAVSWTPVAAEAPRAPEKPRAARAAREPHAKPSHPAGGKP